jgi:hypothetical protein
MSASDFIEIRFTGEGVKPETVKAGDIADILTAVEEMIEACVIRDFPQVSKERVIVGLVDIKGSSVDLKFSSQIGLLAIPAFEEIGEAVTTNEFSKLPIKTLEGLDMIAAFTRRHRCEAGLVLNNGKPKLLGTITPETKITRFPLLTGETTIYGQVVRVGGREPKVMVEMVNGRVIYCDAPIEMARQLGGKLYNIVGLWGLAQWNAKSFDVEKFTIRGVTLYEETPIEEAMKQLAKVAGKYYSNVINVDKYISDIRNSEETD